jgi:transcriptional regulator with XRE-family HTH domain
MAEQKYSVNARIGQRLKQSREDLDLKQKDVAQQLHRSVDFISMSELNKRQISVDDLIAFSHIYKKPVIYFFNDL